MTAEPQSPLKECDLVMKGGVTSGVLYPQVVLELKDEYRFRSIGGGSVGAVAAALTAAAEYGREKGGFQKLKNEQKKLQEPGFLLKVFQPSENTKPLMNTLLDLAKVHNRAKKKAWAAVARNLWLILLRNSPKTFVTGALVGLVLGVALFLVVAEAVASSLSGISLYLPMLIFGLLLGCLFGPFWVVVRLLRILLKELPSKNFYGLCIGHEEPVPGEPQLLTDWLSDVLDNLASLDNDRRPLTFGHLKDKHIREKKPDEPAITLRMLTTNLNDKEPYMFPRKTNTLLFNEAEMRKFFPGCVVARMIETAADTDVVPPEGYHFLPQGDDLPVIVPVRMGLSFPILLSAVPLYTIKESSRARYRESPYPLDPEKDLQRNLFSDGGICSNFPIHFFDAWLPRRPTFGINLTSISKSGDAPGGGETKSTDPTEPWLPKPDESESPQWTQFSDLVGFGIAIFRSAQNYRDNMQSRLPSYKERIVQVPLREGEGGLNLSMDPKTIRNIERRGEKAAIRLKEEFEFDHHRWVRLRVLLSQLEAQLEGAQEALDSIIAENLVDEQLSGGFPYPLNEYLRSEEAKRFLQMLQELVRHLKQSHSDQKTIAATDESRHFPPVTDEELQPTLRVTPDV